MRVFIVTTNEEAGSDNWGRNTNNKSFTSFDKLEAHVNKVLDENETEGYTVTRLTDEDRTALQTGKSGTEVMLDIAWDEWPEYAVWIKAEEAE